MAGDSFGDRMKQQYENRTRYQLPRRTWTILRADGKAFHTFTRGCEKPYDAHLASAMNAAAKALCEEAQGALFAYVQSDEISVLLQDHFEIRTEAWFDGNIQKIVSVSAACVTVAFNHAFGTASAMFDCRAFTIPDQVEVENYFIWRQQDATRNSIQALAQAHFSHKQLQGKNTSQLQEMLFEAHDINWNDLPAYQKRGHCWLRSEDGWQIDPRAPVFTADRAYLTKAMSKPAGLSAAQEGE